MRARLQLATATAGLLWLAGCPGSSGNDAGGDSGSCTSPVGSCTPEPCSTGNSQNVGAYCTSGAGQCNRYPYDGGMLLLCAVDLDPRGQNFCLDLGCHTNADCGEEACCTGNDNTNGPFACIPKGCLVDDGGACPPPPHATSDGGSDGGDGG